MWCAGCNVIRLTVKPIINFSCHSWLAFLIFLRSTSILFFSQTQRSPHVFYRHDLINQLQHNHALVTLVAENLSAYMETMRQLPKGTRPLHMTLLLARYFVDICQCLFFVQKCVWNVNISLFTEEQAEFDPQTVRPGSRYSHVQEVQERLNFLRCNTLIPTLSI